MCHNLRSGFPFWTRLFCLLVLLGTHPAYAQCPVPEDDWEDDDTPGQARRIDPGETQGHTIHASGDLDWVRFNLEVRSDVTLTTDGTSGDTLMTLFGPDSRTQRVARDDNSGEGRFSRIRQPGLLPGKYYVRVEEKGQNSTIDEYDLRLIVKRSGDLFESDDEVSRAKPIQPGATQSRSLDTGADIDWVRFTLDQPRAVTVETTGPEGDTELALFAAGDTTTPIALDDSGNGPFSRLVQPQLAAGDYLLRVRNSQQQPVPSYFLSLLTSDAYEPDDTPETARLLAMGETQERSLHRLGDEDWARFVLPIQSTVRLETDGPVGDTELAVFAEGQLEFPLAEDQNGSDPFSHLQLEALPPGAYLVRVRAPGGAATLPRYTLKFLATDPYEPDDTPETAGQIGVGETQTRSLFTSADVDWVRLTLTVPARVLIETDGPEGNTELLLYSTTPRLRKLVSDNDSGPAHFSRIRRRLNPGTYLFQVRAFRGKAEVPRYLLRVTADE